MSAAAGTCQFQEFVDAVASEIALGTAVAVEKWMAEIELALTDGSLTSLGRLYAVKDVVTRYKQLTGKTELRGSPVRHS